MDICSEDYVCDQTGEPTFTSEVAHELDLALDDVASFVDIYEATLEVMCEAKSSRNCVNSHDFSRSHGFSPTLLYMIQFPHDQA